MNDVVKVDGFQVTRSDEDGDTLVKIADDWFPVAALSDKTLGDFQSEAPEVERPASAPSELEV